MSVQSNQMKQEPEKHEIKTPLRVDNYVTRDVPVTNRCGTIIATFAERHYAEASVRAVNNHEALIQALRAAHTWLSGLWMMHNFNGQKELMDQLDAALSSAQEQS